MKHLCQKLKVKNNNLYPKFCTYFLILNCLILSCKSNVYNEVKPLDGGVWNIMVIKFHDNYLVGSKKYEIIHGNYLYFDFKHERVLIETQDKKIQGHFIIKKNNGDYKFILSNATDSLYNKEYNIALKTISKSSFSTHYSLILKSDNLLIAAKKIQMGNNGNDLN